MKDDCKNTMRKMLPPAFLIVISLVILVGLSALFQQTLSIENTRFKLKASKLPNVAVELPKLIPKQGVWSIFILDLDTGEEQGYNQDQVMEGASTLKLLTALAVRDAVLTKQIDLDSVVSGATIDEHLTVMINRSDNNSWEILNNTVTFERLTQVTSRLDLKKTNVFENTTTARDVGKLLSEIYQTREQDETSAIIYKSMKNTETEGRIPEGLAELEVYHKSGTFDAHIHDAAIVLDDKPFILVIFSQGLSKDQAEPLIRGLSKQIQILIE